MSSINLPKKAFHSQSSTTGTYLLQKTSHLHQFPKHCHHLVTKFQYLNLWKVYFFQITAHEMVSSHYKVEDSHELLIFLTPSPKCSYYRSCTTMSCLACIRNGNHSFLANGLLTELYPLTLYIIFNLWYNERILHNLSDKLKTILFYVRGIIYKSLV